MIVSLCLDNLSSCIVCSIDQLKYPELAKELKRRMSGELPTGWKDNLPKFTPEVRIRDGAERFF